MRWHWWHRWGKWSTIRTECASFNGTVFEVDRQMQECLICGKRRTEGYL